MKSYEMSLRCPPSGDTAGQSVAMTTTSAATTNAVGAGRCVVGADVAFFAVKGSAPTATVAAGIYVPANTLVRLYGLETTDKLAFILAAGTGTVYVRPDA